VRCVLWICFGWGDEIGWYHGRCVLFVEVSLGVGLIVAFAGKGI